MARQERLKKIDQIPWYIFEWHKEKAKINKAKHGVTFDEAATVFGDENALIMPDVSHSDDEDRSIILGWSFTGRILFVCFTERGKIDDEQVIRLISARQANTQDKEEYASYTQK